jgi:hypothetical protein
MQQTEFVFDYAAPKYVLGWREGRAGFRVYGERINPREFEVVHVKVHVEARAFVEGHHYAKSWPSAIEVFELRWRGKLAGVAVFSEPGGPAVLGRWFKLHAAESLDLGRFVLLDEVPGDGETWFLARCFELLRRLGYFGVLSFSDPMPRHRRDGTLIFPGHLGGIYAAFGGEFLGLSAKETVWLFDDGTAYPARARTKIRAYARATTDEALEDAKGWAAAVRRLEGHGAEPFDFEPGDPAAALWCDRELARLARCFRHPGNYRFGWGLKLSARTMIRGVAREANAGKHPKVRLPGKPHIIRRGRAGALLEVAA